MKKALAIIGIILCISCGTSKIVESKRPLYEILIQKNTGGAAVKFYEIISQPDEFVMIKNDPDLKQKINPNDINTANFLILSSGEKNSGGYEIGIEKVEETDKNIIVTVKESVPAAGENVTMPMTNPYCVVRINSKKEIIIK